MTKELNYRISFLSAESKLLSQVIATNPRFINSIIESDGQYYLNYKVEYRSESYNYSTGRKKITWVECEINPKGVWVKKIN